MRLVNIGHFFGELNLFGLEWVIRLAMTGGGRATVVDDWGYCLDRVAAQFYIGKAPRGHHGDVNIHVFCKGRSGRFFFLKCPGRIVALDTAHLFVFALSPGVVAVVKYFGVGQNVAVSAKTLRLGDLLHGGQILLNCLLPDRRSPPKQDNNQHHRQKQNSTVWFL